MKQTMFAMVAMTTALATLAGALVSTMPAQADDSYYWEQHADASGNVRPAKCDWTAPYNVPAVYGVCGVPGETPATVARVNKEAEEHAKRTYERTIENGGCNADDITAEIAGYCFNSTMNSANKFGPIGASSGGSD